MSIKTLKNNNSQKIETLIKKEDDIFETNPQLAIDLAKDTLLNKAPFYLELILLCQIRIGNKIPTASVRILGDTTVELYINPTFFLNLIRKERVGLIIHELGHLFCEHLFRMYGYDKKIANIAMDLVVNQLIPNTFLPSIAITPEKLTKKYNIEFPKNQSFEFYYEILKKLPKQDVDKMNKQTDGSGEPQNDEQQDSDELDNAEQNEYEVLDDHDFWENEGTLNEDTNRKVLSDLINKAVTNTTNNYGSEHVPKEILQMQDKLASKQIPWEKLLRNAIGSVVTKERISTRKKPSRRLGLKSTGKKNGSGPKIIFATDSSASVSDKIFHYCESEIFYASKFFLEKVSNVFFDTEMFKDAKGNVKVHKIGTVKDVPRRPLTGGTNFQPVIDYANKMKPNLLIIITDGEAPPPTKCNCPIIWIIVGKDNPLLSGKRIIIPPNQIT